MTIIYLHCENLDYIFFWIIFLERCSAVVDNPVDSEKWEKLQFNFSRLYDDDIL